MAESLSRVLRDGGLEGEHAPALTIKDTIASPFGLDVFGHVLTQLSSYILEGKSQSRGLVLVAFSRSPSFYVDLLKKKGVDATSSTKWIQILDCYTDPLGWKDQFVDGDNTVDDFCEPKLPVNFCKDVRNMDKVFSSIIELGRGLAQGKDRFSVAIDSVNEMLRHASVATVTGLLVNLRSNEHVSSIFWLLNADLHDTRVIAALEYLSSMMATLEPLGCSTYGQGDDLENMSLIQRNFGIGKFHVRFKRRNGRVKITIEEFHVNKLGISFSSVSSEDGITSQSLLPKVQFSLQLSEKEQIERARVVLPFEHQGNGKPIQIYDGRKSLSESKHVSTLVSTGKVQTNEDTGKGEIIYFRDSDDEMPDSDEDPDDDLDI